MLRLVRTARLRWATSARFFSPPLAVPLLLGRSSLVGKEMRFSSRSCADARNLPNLETIILQSRSFPWCCRPAAQECVDRTNLQATITNENREAAPRLRRPGDTPRTATQHEKHTRRYFIAMIVCSDKNPCAYINRRRQHVRLASAPRRSGRLGRNNHYAETWAAPDTTRAPR